MKKIYIAADHAGFEMKGRGLKVIGMWLRESGLAVEWEMVDCGAYELVPTDDYPDMVESLAEQLTMDLRTGVESRGILFCKTGTGVTIAANKYLGLRAGNCFNVEHTRLAVEHNHINVLALAAEFVDAGRIEEMVEAFLTTEESHDPRHDRRVAMISQIERIQCFEM